MKLLSGKVNDISSNLELLSNYISLNLCSANIFIYLFTVESFWLYTYVGMYVCLYVDVYICIEISIYI